jgi:SNF2-related domain
LKARRRWAVTGTPIVNRLEDLYSLLYVYPGTPLGGVGNRLSNRKFLDFVPWSSYSFFRSYVRPTKADHQLPPNHTDRETRFITLPFIAQDPKAIEIVQVGFCFEVWIPCSQRISRAGHSRKHSTEAAEEHEGPHREANCRASAKDCEILRLVAVFCAANPQVAPLG